MIAKEQVFPIGQIIKPHGVGGEMSFDFRSDVFDRKDVGFLIFEIDGILVPFEIESYRFKNSSVVLLKLDGVDSDDDARVFSGLTVYVSTDYLEEEEQAEIDLGYFTGFMLTDIKYGEIGLVSEVDQTTENVLFVVLRGSDELLIPVGDDYILNIDHEKKILQLELPEGLLDL